MFNIAEARIAKKEIMKLIEENKLNEAEKILKEYEEKYEFDMDINEIKANLYIYSKKYAKAEKELLSIYDKYEYNVDLNYNLAIICYYEEKYNKAFEYLIKAMLIEKGEISDKDELLNNIVININEEDKNKITNSMYAYLTNSQKIFPKYITLEGTSIIKELNYNNKTYYCGISDNYYPERDGIIADDSVQLVPFTKYEVLPGRRSKRVKIESDEKTIVPIMIRNFNQKVNINIDGIDNPFDYLLPNRFYYYKFNEKEKVLIKSDEEFILGNEIKIKKNENLPSLVLNIFVDGLSQTFIEDENLKEVAPNIYNFFKEGTVCNNANSTGEWTYVSLASYFTGKYINNHRAFHPQYDTRNLFDSELYTEVLQKQGYVCAKIDGDYRSNPAYGYMKGLNRYLYQGYRTDGDNAVIETIEHLETFKDNNNFVWICIPDLHDIPEQDELKPSVQVNCSVSSRSYEKIDETSVRQKRDSKKVERYRMQLKRLDTYIGLLLNYIKENYEEDDYIVSLMADHGQGFLIHGDEFLDEERTKVSMMFRGKNIPKGKCDELISGVDFFPIILKSIGSNSFDIKDGNIPKYFNGENSRDYVFTESIFPEAPYYATINDLIHKFFFTTKENSTKDGRIKIENEDDFEIKLINKKTGMDETESNPSKVSRYVEEVINHIKEYIVI